MARRLVLDCDTGSDDAIAIMLACSRPELELIGVTAVWGNHAVEHTADNSLRTLDLIGRTDIGVYAGLAGPIARPADALPAVPSVEPDVLPIPPSSRAVSDIGAVDWLVETARAATEPFTLVATGSMSNVAAAIGADPTFVDAIDELVVMGGVIADGVLPKVETNFGYDPEAARIVLDAGVERIVLVTLNATFQACVTPAQCTELRRSGGQSAALAADFIEQRIARYSLLPAMAGRTAAPVHDALTIAQLVDRSLLTTRPGRVDIETVDPPERGRTDIDHEPTRDGNLHIGVDADAEGFFDLLKSSLAVLP